MTKLIERAIALARPQQVDAKTEEGRSRARIQLAQWGSISNVVSRGASMLLVVLGVYLTVPYLGSVRFGLWATFASMVSMLSMLDLGIGNALVNRVAHVAAQSDELLMRRAVTGGIAVLATVGILSSLLLILVALIVPWNSVFRIHDPAIGAETTSSALCFALLFGLNLATSAGPRILFGQQRSFESNLLSAACTLASCLALALAASFQASIPLLLLVTFGIQSTAGLGAVWILKCRRLFDWRLLWTSARLERRPLLGSGLVFLVLQIGTMVAWGSDSFVLSTLQGPAAVATYAIAIRLFQFASQPVAIATTPLWAAYADASVQNDREFIRVTLKKSLLGSFGAVTILALVLFLAGPLIISAWTSGTIQVPRLTLALIALWTILEMMGNAFGVYLNGCGIMREQVVVVAAFCLLAVPLKVFGAVSWSVDGLMLAAIFSYLAVVGGSYGLAFRERVLRPIRRIA